MGQEQPVNPPILETYGDAMNYLRTPNARVQRLDWVPQQWIFIEHSVVTVHLGSGEFQVYQDMDGYNLTKDWEREWRPVK